MAILRKFPTNNLSELKFSNGLRIYYMETDNTIILLLCGGNKTRQSKDIENAQTYIQDYIERIQ